MQTREFNGRTYCFRDYLTWPGFTRVLEVFKEKSGDEVGQRSEYAKTCIYETMLTADGKKFESIDAVLESIAAIDFYDVRDAAIEIVNEGMPTGNGPLATEKSRNTA
jgi:hypothetical protein